MRGNDPESPYGPFSEEFTSHRLIELCDTEAGIQTGPFGTQLHQRDYVDVGTPIITVEHLAENRILHNDLPRVTDVDRDRLSRYVLREGDIVFSRVGSVDRRALVRAEEDGWMFSGRCLRVRPNPDKVDPGFLSYFFGLPTFKEHVRAIAVGATMPSLNTALLGNLLILHPPKVIEQRAIAHILGTLDDKIELNRRMNETLADLALAVFKSWFVDFDPVTTKADGREPNLLHSAHRLFPDAFADSKLGKIPIDWQVIELGKAFDVAIGKTPPRKEPQWFSSDPVDLPWMSIKDLGNSSTYILHTNEYLTREAVERFRVRRIPAETVVLSFKLTVGRVAITDGEMLSNEAIAHFLPQPETPVGNHYLYCYLKQFDFSQLGSTSSIATAVNSNSVRKIPLIVPDAARHRAFDDIVAPMFRRMKLLQRESQTLTALRDTLLPKLISGELRVPDAERLVSEVV